MICESICMRRYAQNIMLFDSENINIVMSTDFVKYTT